MKRADNAKSTINLVYNTGTMPLVTVDVEVMSVEKKNDFENTKDRCFESEAQFHCMAAAITAKTIWLCYTTSSWCNSGGVYLPARKTLQGSWGDYNFA